MKIYHLYVIVLCILLSRTQSPAQVFHTEKLKQAVEVLGINKDIDSLSSNHTYFVKLNDGQTIDMRVSTNKTVEHIGIPLFNDSIRLLNPSPVYDFLEYALLNWKYTIVPNKLYLSKVIFKLGNWNTLLTNKLDDCDCSIENIDDKLYVVTWKRGTDDIAIVGVPVDYELLYNDNRRVIERDFVKQLSNHLAPANYRNQHSVKENDLKIYGTEGLFVIEGQSYLLPELNQNNYYVFKTITQEVDTILNGDLVSMTLEDVAIVPVVDADHPIESFANIILCNDSVVPEAQLELDIHFSDYRHQQLSMPLCQLKDCCKEQGGELFFACSSIDDEFIKGTLIVKNTSRGYNHLFSLCMNRNSITDKNLLIKAQGYLFIPSITKERLFSKVPSKKSGVIIK